MAPERTRPAPGSRQTVDAGGGGGAAAGAGPGRGRPGPSRTGRGLSRAVGTTHQGAACLGDRLFNTGDVRTRQPCPSVPAPCAGPDTTDVPGQRTSPDVPRTRLDKAGRRRSTGPREEAAPWLRAASAAADSGVRAAEWPGLLRAPSAQAGPDSRGPEGARPIPGVTVTVPRTRHLLACWPLCRWRWPPSRDTGKTAARDLRAQTCPRGQPGTSAWHRWLADRSRPGRGRASALLRRQAAEVQPAPGSGRGGPAPVTL